MKKCKVEFIIGAVILIAYTVIGITSFASVGLVFRMVVGLLLGYSLVRSSFGFAGAVNRAYLHGSTRLMQILMWMFLATSVIVAAFMAITPDKIGLWINPINLGLLVGGLLFGFGMAMSVCCASGVLTDLVSGPIRAFVTLLFFGIGVFLGFPVQKASFVTDSWFSSASYSSGVYFPDWFKFDGLNGYLGATILTALLCFAVIGVAKWYENKRRNAGTYYGTGSEKIQDNYVAQVLKSNEMSEKGEKVFSQTTFDRLFVNPWTLGQGALMLTLAFALLMGFTGGGWGASTPLGWWFGRLLTVFGVSADSLASFTGLGAATFTGDFFANAMNIQNVSIVIGALVALLLAGQFTSSVKSELKVSVKDILIFALGGFTMGFGTRLANGCNVGALYTPIANFSLSGWIFLVVLVAGGVIGNIFKSKVYKGCVE